MKLISFLLFALMLFGSHVIFSFTWRTEVQMRVGCTWGGELIFCPRTVGPSHEASKELEKVESCIQLWCHTHLPKLSSETILARKRTTAQNFIDYSRLASNFAERLISQRRCQADFRRT